MNRKELEIMAPAGNFECLRAAIEGGADSVYFGVGNLNMRAHSANNFKPEDLKEVTRICREAGKTVFLSTHDLELALQTADMLWLMSHEKRLEIGTPKELAANGALSQFIERPGIRFDRESLTVIIIENWELKR